MNTRSDTASSHLPLIGARVDPWVARGARVVGASLFVAACAQVAVPIGPVPVSLVNFAVLLVGMLLGPWIGAASLMLYLIEGAAGLPFFAPTGPGGVAQLLGPTGGYLLSYPLVAFVAGWFAREREFATLLGGAILAEIVLFASGAAWLAATGVSGAQIVMVGIAPFIPGEVLKIAAAATIARWWFRRSKHQTP